MKTSKSQIGSSLRQQVLSPSSSNNNFHSYRWIPCLQFIAVAGTCAIAGRQHSLWQTINMPEATCAFGCSNRRKPRGNLSFYRISFGNNEQSLELRKKWIAAISRENWSSKKIDNALICSAHFISGRWSSYCKDECKFRKLN